MIVKGSLKCPICGSLGAIYNDLEEISLFEKKGDKWIFHYYIDDFRYNTSKENGWIGCDYFKDYSVEYDTDEWGYETRRTVGRNKSAEECWDRTGGSTLEKWQKHFEHQMKCKKCNFTSYNFIDFIPK